MVQVSAKGTKWQKSMVPISMTGMKNLVGCPRLKFLPGKMAGQLDKHNTWHTAICHSYGSKTNMLANKNINCKLTLLYLLWLVPPSSLSVPLPPPPQKKTPPLLYNLCLLISLSLCLSFSFQGGKETTRGLIHLNKTIIRFCLK